MGILQNENAIPSAAGAAAFYDHQIEQSVRLPRSTTDNTGANGGGLYRNSSGFPTPTDSKKFTFSTWVKKSGADLNLRQTLISNMVSGSEARISLDYNSSSYYDKVYSEQFGTGTYSYDAVLRDVSGWYHLVFIWDTTQSSAVDRQKFYINGTQQDVGSTRSNWSLNDTVHYNTAPSNTNGYSIGYHGFLHTEGYSYGLYGYLAETIGIDGQDVSISDLGETKNSVWIPKEYTGSFGNNGFRLTYSNASSLGADSSGNGNDFSTTNLGADHQVLDSPTFGS
jgi:hypothetical protein